MIRRSTNELSIRPKMARRTKLQIIFASFFGLAAALYGSYWFGLYSANAQYGSDRAQTQVLRKEIAALNEQLRSAQDDLIYAERQKQIQEEAYKQISLAYANSEQKNQVLGSTLDFYRSIISPEDNQTGPAIHALEHTIQAGRIGFNVTLVQAIKHKLQIRGQLRVQAYLDEDLIGQWPGAIGRSVSYQYFTRISGAIDAQKISPENESRIRLTVTLERPNGESLSRTFALSDLPESN